MSHSRTVKHSASRVAVLALAGGGMMIPAAAAMAAPATSWSSAPVSYTCSLSGFGQGIAPLTVNATMSAPASVAAGTSQSVKLVTSSVQIPSGVAAQLGQINSIGLSGASQLTWGSSGTAGWSGQAALTGHGSVQAGTSGLTQIPSMTMTGTVSAKSAGWGTVGAPQSFQVQLAAGTTQLPPVTCTATQKGQVTVTATGAGGTGTMGGAGTAGGTGTAGSAGTQVFVCTISAGSTTMGTSQIPMQLGHSGKGTMGSPEKVWMSSSGAFSGSAGSQWASASPMGGSTSLGLSGASQGSVPLGWSGNAGSGQLAFAGQWMPKATGMFQMSAPRQFSMQAKASQGIVLTAVCKAVTPTPATMQVQVMGAGAQAAGGAGAVPAAGGNGNAPNTGAGGSLNTSVDLALAAGGVALVLGGAGFGLLAFRRRGHSAL